MGYAATPGRKPPRRRRRRLLWLVTAVATALTLGAGVVSAYTLLAGTGARLDTWVPADAVAYVEVNLDPPAGQKVAALRFFRHLPNTEVREDSRDLIDGLVEPLADAPQARRELADNIKPWLGKHLAFAADPQGPRTEPVLIVESTDSAKARTGLDSLAKDGTATFGYVLAGRIAVLARTQAAAQAAVDDANRGSLHGSDTFRSDIRSVPSGGVLTAWFDLSRAGSLSSLAGADRGTAAPAASSVADLHGRIVGSLRFSDTTADLVIHGVGLNQVRAAGEAPEKLLATLPADTGMAVAVSGADKAIQQLYERATKAGWTEELRSFEETTHLVLPDDLAALLGSSTVVAVGGTAGRVDWGLVSHTGDVDKARSAAERLVGALANDSPIAVKTVAGGTVVANSSSYADKLAAPGTLGDTESFRTALPDLHDAQFALYVDGKRATEIGGGSPSGPAASVRAFGFTAGWRGDTASMHLRVVVG